MISHPQGYCPDCQCDRTACRCRHLRSALFIASIGIVVLLIAGAVKCNAQQFQPYGPAPGYSAPQASYPGPASRRLLLPHYPGMPVRNYVRRVLGWQPLPPYQLPSQPMGVPQ